MMNWYGNGMSGWGYAVMAVNMVVVWGLIIAGIVLLVRYLPGGRLNPADSKPGGQAPGSTAEQILADRFARGEVNEQEYQQRVRILRDLPPT